MKRKVKGIVLEINNKYLVVLTPGGEYLKIRHPGGDVKCGDEIPFTLPASGHPKIFTVAAASAAAVLLLLFNFLFDFPALWMSTSPDKAAHGYLALDINPGVELAFNRERKVFAYRTLDEKAELLMEDFPEGEPLDKAVEWLIDRSASMELIQPGEEENWVMVSLLEEDINGRLINANQIHELIDQKLKNMGIPAYVSVFETDDFSREKAREAGISLNRFLLGKALQEQGVKELPEDAPLPEMMKELKAPPPNSVIEKSGKPEKLPEVPVGEDEGRGRPLDEPGRIPDTPTEPPGGEGKPPITPPGEKDVDPSEERGPDADIPGEAPAQP